jgi:hypothetical protein
MADSDEAAIGESEETSDHRVGAGLSAGAAVLFLLLRLMAVSHWNWHTAFNVADVVDFSDAVSIVYGTLFAEPVYTSILVMWLLPLVAVRLIWPPQRPQISVPSSVMLLVAVLSCAVALVITYREWWLVLGAVLVGAALVAARLVWRHGVVHDGVVRVMRSTRITAAVGALILSAVVTVPWTPLEHVHTKSGVIDGYVMKVESGYLRVLTKNHRHLEIIARDDVTGRT